MYTNSAGGDSWAPLISVLSYSLFSALFVPAESGKKISEFHNTTGCVIISNSHYFQGNRWNNFTELQNIQMSWACLCVRFFLWLFIHHSCLEWWSLTLSHSCYLELHLKLTYKKKTNPTQRSFGWVDWTASLWRQLTELKSFSSRVSSVLISSTVTARKVLLSRFFWASSTHAESNELALWTDANQTRLIPTSANIRSETQTEAFSTFVPKVDGGNGAKNFWGIRFVHSQAADVDSIAVS